MDCNLFERIFIMKKLISLVVLVVVMFSVSGCRTIPSVFEDLGGTCNAIAGKLTPLRDKAIERDVYRSVAKNERYHAERAGFTAFKRSKQQ